MLTLKYATFILLGLSILTLLSKGILAFLRLKNLESPFTRKVEAVAGAVAATLVVWQVGFSGASLVRHDQGAERILDYYRDIRNSNFEDAWSLVHRARQDELKSRGWSGAADIRASYITTAEFGTITADLDRQDANERLYWVTLDVKDRLPRNSLYGAYANEPTRKAIDDGLLNRNKLMNMVLADIRRDYELPTKQIENAENYLLGEPLNSALGPKTVIDIATSLKLNRKHYGSELDVWTHYIEYLSMVNDKGWKIRSGLWPPILEAYYPAGSRIRSK
jgi:hypothetical protein